MSAIEERATIWNYFKQEGWDVDPRRWMDFITKNGLMVEVSYMTSDQIGMEPSVMFRTDKSPKYKYKHKLDMDKALLPQVKEAIVAAKILGAV